MYVTLTFDSANKFRKRPIITEAFSDGSTRECQYLSKGASMIEPREMTDGRQGWEKMKIREDRKKGKQRMIENMRKREK